MVQTVRRGIWIWLGKAFLAGVIAFIALTLFCMLYDDLPVHYASADGATDYHWQPHRFYMRCTEGFSWGRTNNEGYINTFDYTGNDPVDVLVMGASHMESMQVPLGMSAAARLGALMPDACVYNIGISGHYLPVCAQNLPAAIEKYAPAKYVVIETMTLRFPDDELRGALAGELPGIPSYSGGIMGLLQQNQLLRRIYHQLKSFQGHADDGEAAAPADAPTDGSLGDTATLSALLARMADTAAATGARVIIAYHPGVTLERDGSLRFSASPVQEEAFAGLCAENGVYFLNMRDRFQTEYDEDHVLPYGFANTAVGAGHLNRYGHEMMAEELYALMREVGL